MTDLLQIRDLHKHYPDHRGLSGRRNGPVRAVDGVDLTLRGGECLAIVGESGCGKSTLARCVMALEEPTRGRILLAGEDLTSLEGAALRGRRRDFQMVFQDPVGSLHPRWTVSRILTEPLEIHQIVAGDRRRARVEELLEMVGLPASAGDRYAHELSGGQRQRVGIARALASEPRLLVADEAVSALDVSVRGQILNLLGDLRERLGLAILFITHDLAVVRRIAHRVAVMYAGKIIEQGTVSEVTESPGHPYTVSLLAAASAADRVGSSGRFVLAGEPPDPSNPPAGCRFHPRCALVEERCRSDEPPLVAIGEGHRALCHLAGAIDKPA